jgi:hypothetical protein
MYPIMVLFFFFFFLGGGGGGGGGTTYSGFVLSQYLALFEDFKRSIVLTW